MSIVIKIVGIVFIFAGAVYLIKPDVIKSLMNFFKQGRRLYFAGLIRFALAVVFLLAARECDITWVIAAFGILFLMSGLLIFMLGLDRSKSIIDWWQKQPLLLLRVVALLTMAFGAIITYSA